MFLRHITAVPTAYYDKTSPRVCNSRPRDVTREDAASNTQLADSRRITAPASYRQTLTSFRERLHTIQALAGHALGFVGSMMGSLQHSGLDSRVHSNRRCSTSGRCSFLLAQISIEPAGDAPLRHRFAGLPQSSWHRPLCLQHPA